MEMNKEQLKQTLGQSEKTRMELVNKINAKREKAKMFGVGWDNGENPKNQNFIDDYNNLVDEHNRILDMQNSIVENAYEYARINGDVMFQEYLNASGFDNWNKKRLEKKQVRLEEKKQKAIEKGNERKVKRLDDRLEKTTLKVETIAKGGTSKDARKAVKAAGLDVGTRMGQKVKTVALSAPRSSMLLLIRLNLWGLASSMGNWKKTSPVKYNAVRNKWYKMGGNRTAFDEAIEKGSKLKPVRFLYKKNLIKSFTGQDALNVAGGDDVLVISSIITSASGILVALLDAFKKQGGAVDAPAGVEMPTIDPEVQAAIAAEESLINAGIDDPDDSSLYWIIGITGALVLTGIGLAIYFGTKKK